MLNETINSDMDILRLCPESEQSLNDLASDVIKVILTPEKRIRKSDQERAHMILTLGRRIIQFGGCIRFNHLSGIDCTESLYKHEGTDVMKNLRRYKDTDDCLLLGKYIIVSCISNELKNHLLKQLARNIFHSPSEEEVSFLCGMWELRDEIPLTAETIEELVIGFPFCMEQFLLVMVEKIVVSNNADVDDFVELQLNSFWDLCSKSSLIFQMVLSILHEFLLGSDINEQLLYFIATFVHHVEFCKKSGFLDLFPYEHKLLVTLLHIKPSLYGNDFIDSDFTKTNACNILSNYVRCNRRIGGALLSYYPDWLPYIYNYCVDHSIFELIPNKREDGERRETYLKFILQSYM